MVSLPTPGPCKPIGKLSLPQYQYTIFQLSQLNLLFTNFLHLCNKGIRWILLYCHDYFPVGNSVFMGFYRLSFFFNLKGPSYALDSTWCGGVQALQYAHDLISLGHVEAAIVGSCSLLFKPQVSVHYQGKLKVRITIGFSHLLSVPAVI